jgi:predicted nucleic acid-binding protein
MENVALVDSCVLIGLLREGRDPAIELLRRSPNMDLATCGMVRVEVIRGLVALRLRRAVEGFMDVMRNVPTDNRLWEEAATLAWELDRQGTVLPAQDVVIACCARRIDAAVLTWDTHFGRIPNLRVLKSLEELK